jgi:hypothetical protein
MEVEITCAPSPDAYESEFNLVLTQEKYYTRGMSRQLPDRQVTRFQDRA